MEREENDSAVFRPFHKPWKSIKPIPTFPPPRRRRSIYERIPKRSRPCCPPQTDPSGSSLDWKRLTRSGQAPRLGVWLQSPCVTLSGARYHSQARDFIASYGVSRSFGRSQAVRLVRGFLAGRVRRDLAHGTEKADSGSPSG